jgi:hypothetical protein
MFCSSDAQELEMMELSKVLADLRDELIKAQTVGEGSKLRFLIDDIELELQVAVTAEGNGKAGFKVLTFFSAEAEGKGTGSATQKLRLKLKITDKQGNTSVPISGEDER